MVKTSTEIARKVKFAKDCAANEDFTTAAMALREAASLYDQQAAEKQAATRTAQLSE